MPFALLFLAACSGGGDDTGPAELPPEDTAGLPDDTVPDTFFVDTSYGETGFDGDPQHLVTLRYDGRWVMTPAGGPYTAMTGTLELTEVLDGAEDAPTCVMAWSLTGEVAEVDCDGCLVAFEVLHYTVDGEKDEKGLEETCYDPERPEDGDTWRLGYHRADRAVLRDWEETGVWIPWFDAEEVDDTLILSWEATVGVAIEDTG